MFDILTLAALREEISDRLLGGRVQKIVQTSPLALAIEVYAGRRLTIIADADPQDPRLLLTERGPASDPEQVTPLLLLLRKYVRGGRLIEVGQPPLERVLWLTFEKFLEDEHRGRREAVQAGELVRTRLAIELMGRHSNLILVSEDGRVHDAIKRVTPAMSAARPILPGRPYEPPPPQVKRDPRRLTPDGVLSLAREAAPAAELPSVLVQALAGFSPQMAREATYRACGTFAVTAGELAADPVAAERLARAVNEVIAPLERGGWEPTVYLSDDQPVAFAAIRLSYLGGLTVEVYPTMSAAIERYFAQRASGPAAIAERHARRRQRLLQQIEEARERAEARLRALEQELERAREAEQWRQMGELIYAYLAAIQPGQTELVVEGLQIPLDPELSPSENAQAYFERYRKAQSAAQQVPPRIDEALRELAYLEQLAVLTRLAESAEELEQLRQEWELFRAPRRDHESPRRRRSRAPAFRRPRAWVTSRGDRIYVGRHGRENDSITFELARPDDAWLHARGLAGAHVVVHWAGPEDPAVLETAAALAAWYSDGRGSSRVPVDVTQRRYVRRIPGAGPGLVSYRNERTLHVRPQSPESLGLRQD
ncbi:Rqc2 family fibronectin-binding protein [Thermalbibacter longus]|uniref:Rqc2 family fibronectin-binding protein n=1 Tax=Thermalbibacter longus TaxID=2951981 RepID=UPI00325FDA82